MGLRANFSQALQTSWQTPNLLSTVLRPLSGVYGMAMALRKQAYQHALCKSYRAPVPVIVVGNITVGGTGKTPLVIYLIEQLRQRGYTPGVISRGYASKATAYPVWVSRDTPVSVAGDEATLIVKRTGAPMVIGPNRQADIELLFANANSAVDVIISDDGLQHLALQRDIEICLLDHTRQQSNQQTNEYLLPAGPYRETKTRLASVDFVVHHRSAMQLNHPPSFTMTLVPQLPNSLLNQEVSFNPQGGVHAVAGIGNPQRFFNTCRAQGWQIEEHVFADHHQFVAEDIHFGDTQMVVMTEKDAVKCFKFANKQHWYLPVDAKLDDAFINAIVTQLNRGQNE